MTIDSCRSESDVQEFESAFAMLQPVSGHAQGQSLSFSNSFFRGLPVSKHTRQLKHLREPASILFLLISNSECHSSHLCEIIQHFAALFGYFKIKTLSPHIYTNLLYSLSPLKR